MNLGVSFLQLFVALACFTALKKLGESIGLDIPVGLLMLAALVVLVILQVRWANSSRALAEAQRDNLRPPRRILSLRSAIAVAALAMTAFVALVVSIVPSSDFSARDTFLSVGYPGWTCLVAMKLYGAYLSDMSAARRARPLLVLWLIQAFVVFVVPGLMDMALRAGSTFYLNTQPIAVVVLAGIGVTYYSLSGIDDRRNFD